MMDLTHVYSDSKDVILFMVDSIFSFHSIVSVSKENSFFSGTNNYCFTFTFEQNKFPQNNFGEVWHTSQWFTSIFAITRHKDCQLVWKLHGNYYLAVRELVNFCCCLCDFDDVR